MWLIYPEILISSFIGSTDDLPSTFKASFQTDALIALLANQISALEIPANQSTSKKHQFQNCSKEFRPSIKSRIYYLLGFDCLEIPF